MFSKELLVDIFTRVHVRALELFRVIDPVYYDAIALKGSFNLIANYNLSLCCNILYICLRLTYSSGHCLSSILPNN